MVISRRQLLAHIERWAERGWVTAAGADAIRAEVSTRRGPSLAGALAVLAAVLLGFAAMTFVAANWQAMSKLVRLAVLGVGLWAAYGASALLRERGLPRFAEAAVLAGVGMFGASIMLISQMYHLDGHPPDAVLLWSLGALLAGVVLRSVTALTASALLALLWSAWTMTLGQNAHLSFLPVWAAIAAAFYRHGAWSGLHVSLATLAGWLMIVSFTSTRVFGFFGGGTRHALIGVLGVGAALAAAFASQQMPRLRTAAGVALGYASLVGYWGLGALQFIETGTRGGNLLVLAVITLALLIALVAWGWRRSNRALVWLGYTGFSLEILGLYFKTLGTLLSTSLFFLVASLIVAALAALALRLHRQGSISEETPS